MAASTADPAALRRRPWQTRPYLRLLAMVALLGSPAWAAAVDPYSMQIKPTALATASPSVPVVEAPIPTSTARLSMHAQVPDQGWDLKRRAEDEDETSSSSGKQSSSSSSTKTSSDAKKTTSASASDKSSSGTKTATTDKDDSMTTFTVSIRTSTTTTASNSPLPSAFDDSIPTDFKLSNEDSSCPTFMSDLLNHQTFKDCLPISMMMETSQSFFNARKQLTSTVRVLDKSCRVDTNACTKFMENAAKNLTKDENCSAEYKGNLKTIVQAYRGLRAYQTMYSATCLEDPDSGMYCFANAVTNLSAPSDAYLYLMPYDLNLPGSSTPTCNWCNKETMAIWHAASADTSQSLSQTYTGAARQFNTLCGPNFVNETTPEAGGTVANGPAWSVFTLTLALAFMLGSFL
ncbi:unnamed protein product [Clonostachys rosea]|uniref:DUF7729 domain-containing protein n=1 Tax=Bionectria ochroleuca TaxID=29856 RepID=A0ABY6U5W4_BIOOC|nr:unnamed protein product [Clonostachys rosea]